MFKASQAVVAIALASAALALSTARAEEVKGNVAAGQQKNAMCIGCHGIVDYKTGFPDVHRVPKLYGQNAAYIAAALGEYRQGDRKHPSMRAVAQTLSDQDIADLAAYFAATTAGVHTASAEPADAEAAKAVLAKSGCTSCHGADFNKPISPAYPKLAGQHSDYLFYALKAYQTQNKAFTGRGNPIMAGMARQLSVQDMQRVASYLETLSGDLTTVQRPRLR